MVWGAFFIRAILGRQLLSGKLIREAELKVRTMELIYLLNAGQYGDDFRCLPEEMQATCTCNKTCWESLSVEFTCILHPHRVFRPVDAAPCNASGHRCAHELQSSLQRLSACIWITLRRNTGLDLLRRKKLRVTSCRTKHTPILGGAL